MCELARREEHGHHRPHSGDAERNRNRAQHPHAVAYQISSPNHAKPSPERKQKQGIEGECRRRFNRSSNRMSTEEYGCHSCQSTHYSENPTIPAMECRVPLTNPAGKLKWHQHYEEKSRNDMGV